MQHVDLKSINLDLHTLPLLSRGSTVGVCLRAQTLYVLRSVVLGAGEWMMASLRLEVPMPEASSSAASVNSSDDVNV